MAAEDARQRLTVRRRRCTTSEGKPSTAPRTTSSPFPPTSPPRTSGRSSIYDPQTRSELQTTQPFPSKNNTHDKLTANADGSVDLYFGPTAPAGKEANWIETVPGKSWFAILRLYGPLEPWFDKTWRPGDIEPLDAE